MNLAGAARASNLRQTPGHGLGGMDHVRHPEAKARICHRPGGQQYPGEPLESFEGCVRRLAEEEAGPASWLEYCVSRRIYQQLNQEFVDELAEVLRETARGEILELAAGHGELAAALNARGLRVRATDPGGWPGSAPPEWVEASTAGEALRCYRPHTVLVCWPPVDARVYRSIFATRSVHHVVEIGFKSRPSLAASESMATVRQFVPHRRCDGAFVPVLIESPEDVVVRRLRNGRRHHTGVQQVSKRHIETLRPALFSRAEVKKSVGRSRSSSECVERNLL